MENGQQAGVNADLMGKVRVQFNRYFGLVRRIWWLLPLTVSIGTAISAWWVSQMPPAYLSAGRMMVAGQLQFSQGASYNEAAANFFGTQIQLMQSGAVRQKALARVETLHPELPPEEVDYEVVQEPMTSIFLLKATSQSPVFAQAYLDACMTEYIEAKRKQRLDATENTNLNLTSEMARLNAEVDKNEDAIRDFQKSNNIGFLQTEGNNAAAYLNQLNQQLSELQKESDLLQLLDIDQTLDRQQNQANQAAGGTGSPDDAKQDTSLTSYGPIGAYQAAKQQIALYQADLADKSERLKPKHPDIIALNEEVTRQQALIVALRQQAVDALKTHQETLKLQIENLKVQIKTQEDKALDLSGKLAEFDKLKNKADRTKAEYDRLFADSQSVSVTKNVDQDTITVLEPASQAISVKPGLLRIIMAGIGGGFMVGLAIIFILDQMDDRVSSLMELQRHFPEHLLGQIPQEKFDGDQTALLRMDDDRQALLESFRTLRSSIIFLPVEGKRPKTIVITSSLPNEGKTTVASNLAVTLAFSGAKVLIVDADMRSGKLSKLFGAGGGDGLSTILQQKIAWSDTIYTTTTPNLFVLPCGPALHHTAEHLLGKVTDQFLRDVYEAFDYVLFDSPPVIILDDTLSLAPKIDATLFVVRFNSSSVRASRRALELLTRRQANIIGLVCNGVTLSETEYNYNYNYRHYGGKYAEVKASA